ncbi:MAG: hypothetical protein ACRESE_09535 [Gammaproteobacteria bacterium]
MDKEIHHVPSRMDRCCQQTLAIVQPGNNHSACFCAGEDCQHDLEIMTELAGWFSCSMHAFALLTAYFTDGKPAFHRHGGPSFSFAGRKAIFQRLLKTSAQACAGGRAKLHAASQADKMPGQLAADHGFQVPASAGKLAAGIVRPFAAAQE